MDNQYVKPYLESSVFIAWIRGEKIDGVDRKKVVDHILTLAEQGHYKIVTSTWTLAEVHKRKSGPVLSKKEDDRFLDWFEHDYILPVDVSRAIGEQANQLARKYGLKPTDSVHLACAIRAECDVLLSYDPDFLNLKDPPMKIKTPAIIPLNPLPLFDQEV